MADINGFLEAVQAGDLPRVELMLADHTLATAENREGVSGLLVALYHGHPAVARAIASRKPQITVFEAAALGDVDRVRALVNRNPELVQSFAADGHSVLGLAAYFGQRAVLEQLLARGADPNLVSKNPMRVAPLHSAVAHRSPGVAVAMARLLLERGADPNARQHGGWTPMHAAAANGNRELAALLLQHGAEAAPKNDLGRTPAELAREFGFAGIAEWLEGRSR